MKADTKGRLLAGRDGSGPSGSRPDVLGGSGMTNSQGSMTNKCPSTNGQWKERVRIGLVFANGEEGARNGSGAGSDHAAELP